MRATKGVLLHCDPALKVYLTKLRESQTNLFGADPQDIINLDDQHTFVFGQTAQLVSNLQPEVDKWIISNTYLQEKEDDDNFDN